MWHLKIFQFVLHKMHNLAETHAFSREVSGFIYLRALCLCNARLNQNLYVNNYFFINLLKINNKNK